MKNYQNEKKILFMVSVTAPYHGASVVNQYIQNSSQINNKFITEYHNISPGDSMDEVGKISIQKIYITFKILIRSIIIKIRFKPNLVYITLSPHGPAFYKDSLLVLIYKLLRTKVCIHMHGKGIHDEISKSFFKRYFYKLVFNNTYVIHLSAKLLSDINGLISRKKVYIVNNGVEDYKEDKVDNHATTKINFLYLSNFVPEKGAHTLLDALQNVPKNTII